MKIIKSVLFFLFLSISFYGQNGDSLQNSKRFRPALYTPGLGDTNGHYVLKMPNFQTDVPTLVLYNKTTNLYDTYLNINNSYIYSGATTRFKNRSNFFTSLFLGNDSFSESNSLLPNRSILLTDDLNYRVRDSFNPHGASTISEALLGGVLGLLFN